MKKLFICALLSLIGMNSYAKQDLFCPAVVYCPTVNQGGCVVSSNWKILFYNPGSVAPGYMTFISAERDGMPPFPVASAGWCNYSGPLYQQELTLESVQYDLRPDTELFGNRWANAICNAVQNAFDCPFETVVGGLK